MSIADALMSQGELSLRLKQQQSVADFGVFALHPGPIERLLARSCIVAAEGLETKLAKILQFRPDQNDLIVAAGIGWHAGVVGHSTLGAGTDSPAGYALHTGQPTLSNHMETERRFRVPALLAEHGVQSAINVVIGGAGGEPFGVLEVDSTTRSEFVTADVAFLQSLANVLAAAVVRAEADQLKDSLLRDKDLLMREVHHRVKNSLQMVRTVLGLQSRTASVETREQLELAAARIMSIAAVHQRLYEGGSVSDADARIYLTNLLGDIGEVLGPVAKSRHIVLNCEELSLPADALTPLGLIVSELVTNAIKHGAGTIDVTVKRQQPGLLITVDDAGAGFTTDERPHQGFGMRLVSALAKGRGIDPVKIDRTVPHGRIHVAMAL